ncbi:Hydroxyacid oxidase 1 [Mycoemilia scoparia]|uniref:Hydroxyacid oxidase 1 n=1 Tax=Mycoemilia scoparia TaxID=417184 RepID=A0A9W7ZYP7_9FUNG|nr:Hydroxyacid oxidase 1 [Mycoemilia scoparia]
MAASPTAGVPVCIDDFEAIAKSTLPAATWGYYTSGANDEDTLRDNREAFRKYKLRPRILRDVSKVNTTTTILGKKARTPLCVAPCAMHELAHPDGEIGTSKGQPIYQKQPLFISTEDINGSIVNQPKMAVADLGSVMILSTYSTKALEKVIAANSNPDTHYWFQLYVYKERGISEKLVRRAEAAGFEALVLTVDAPVLGRRLLDARNRFNPPPYIRLENFIEGSATGDGTLDKSESETFGETFGNRGDAGLTWEEGIAWLRSITKLPIILKGVLTAEDTELAVKYGCAGVIVSNHGGRQLDGVLATIDALPEVVEAANGRIEVYMDGGVRKGTDIIKALALGARAVFIARPILYGLAYNGEAGAKLALKILQDELESGMALSGCRDINDINESLIHFPGHQPQPRRLGYYPSKL